MADAIVSNDAPSPSNCMPAFGTSSETLTRKSPTPDWSFVNDIPDPMNTDCSFAIGGLQCFFKTSKPNTYRVYQTSLQESSRSRHWMAEYVVEIAEPILGEWVISQFRAGSTGAAQIRVRPSASGAKPMIMQLGSSAGSPRPITGSRELSYGVHTVRVELDFRDAKYSANASVDGMTIGTLPDLGLATLDSDLVQIGPFYEPLMPLALTSSVKPLYKTLLVQTCP
jgi:hypothetical protein